MWKGIEEMKGLVERVDGVKRKMRDWVYVGEMLVRG